MPEDPFDLEFGSDQHHALLEFFNKATIQPNASIQFDILSGAYRFTDESPVIGDDSDLGLRRVTLLRILCAYRISVIRGSPRMELAHWWELAKAKAPNWAGFAEGRCSADAIPFMTAYDLHLRTFCKDTLKLERQFRNRKHNDSMTPEG
jgi:hypothetical protein